MTTGRWRFRKLQMLKQGDQCQVSQENVQQSRQSQMKNEMHETTPSIEQFVLYVPRMKILNCKRKQLFHEVEIMKLKKHKNSCHPTIPVDEVKRNIVFFNHASVPKSLRERKSKEQPALHTDGAAKRPEPCDAEPGETTAANNLSVTDQPESGNEDHYSNGEQEGVDHSQLSQNAEYSGSDSIKSPATTMQNTRDF